MAKIVWDEIGERYFRTGVDHCVLYPEVSGAYPKGVAWNGITNITDSPSGADNNDFYADNIKYISIRGTEDFGLNLDCYFYPEEWGPCDGQVNIANGVRIGQQRRQRFGLSYRNKIGNDTDGEDHGYEIHLVYGATASPSEMAHDTVNDSPDLGTISYDITTTPVTVDDTHRPVSHIVIDSTKVNATKLESFKDIIYGTAEVEPRLPLPAEVLTHFAEG